MSPEQRRKIEEAKRESEEKDLQCCARPAKGNPAREYSDTPNQD